MRKAEIENLIKENIKDTALRIYELDKEDENNLQPVVICEMK